MRLIPPALIRQYRARGHGIHSPFAFSFIGDVLTESGSGYGYYSYPELNRLAANSHEARLARLLLRLVSRIPHGVGPIQVANPTPALVRAVEGASGERRLLVINSNRLVEEAQTIIDGEGVIVITDDLAHLGRRLKESMTHGMSFTSGRGLTVIVSDTTLPLQHFKLSFS